MIADPTPRFRVVLYEGTGSHSLSDSIRFEITKSLLEKGHAVTSVQAGAEVSSMEGGSLLVLGRFTEERPLEGKSNGSHVRLVFRNIEGVDPARVLELVEEVRDELQVPEPGEWKPWFPVIDYSRCTNCMQCLSFCLFDVYGVSAEQQIQVQNENKCKTDCPACSRVCPEVAILFPKYRSGPINGDEINPEDVQREAMKVDISALLGGDIYQTLRDRSAKAKSRFSKERDEDRALKERQRCLVKLAGQMDVPPEVLASLPSLDQIQEKAQEAYALAKKARGDSEPSSD